MTQTSAHHARYRSTITKAEWDAALLTYAYRVDGDATTEELLAGVPLVRRYGSPRGRSLDSKWGASVRPIVGSSASLWKRIVEHRAADASVWIAVLRAQHGAAETALVNAERPHQDPTYQAAVLRLARPNPQLLLRVAEHARGSEFERVARRVVKHVCWLATFNAPFAAGLLERFTSVAAPEIAAAPRTLWHPLLQGPDADVRLQAFLLTSTGCLA